MLNIYKELSWLPQPPADFSEACRGLVQQPDSAGLKVKALASHALDENQSIRLAKAVDALRRAGRSLAPLTPYRLAVASNSTTSFLEPVLIATAARYGIALECVRTGYDQATQEILTPDSPLYQAAPQALLVALDWRGLPLQATPGVATERDDAVKSALGYLTMLCEGFRQNSGGVCILQNLAAPPETVFGSFERVLPGARRNVIDGVNQGIAELAYRSSHVMFDLASLAETVGLASWHDPNQWHLAKLPFCQNYVPLYAEHICRIIAALLGKNRRCLVLDLDNTLWGGVIGDDGLQGIQIAQGDATGEAYLSFQRYILSLRDRGVVLAVSSKNNDETARLPFRNHPEMLLREEHFAVFQANWNDKATNITAISKELSLGLESLVFVDDNPAERDIVRRSLPQVGVPEMPADPALYARTLSAAGYFEAVALSDEDRNRANYYAGNARRAALEQQVGDIESYLASLQMEIWFQPFDATGRSRIAQLINKSNQFNLTTKRYSEAEVARLESDPECLTMQVRLTDRFGDNGMISVVVCRTLQQDTWEIDLWLMSCRVLGRRVENMVLRELLEHARRWNIRRLLGVYRPTERNKLVEEHYPKLKFAFLERRQDGSVAYELNAASPPVLETAPMNVRSSGFEAPCLLANRTEE